MIPRDEWLANGQFPELVNLVWNAAYRDKHWRAHGEALEALARLILDPGPGRCHLEAETDAFYRWAETQRSLYALESLANRGEPPTPVPNTRCRMCGWTVEDR